MSTHAQAAKAIKQELKKTFPETKFSVRSQTFAGGDSVRIEWNNGPTYESVQALTRKYQYGHFDCMDDSYTHSNSRNDIPQVKYVQWNRNIAEEIVEKVFKYLQATHSHLELVSSVDESSYEISDAWGGYTTRSYIYRLLKNEDLTHGWKPRE